MKQILNYGRITLSHSDFDPDLPCVPYPFMKINPIKVNGKILKPQFSPNDCLSLLKLKSPQPSSFRETYLEWRFHHSSNLDLGEGRSFVRWLHHEKRSIKWNGSEFKLHDYFSTPLSPKHDPEDELARGLSFAIKPIWVEKRCVKLYLDDESVLSLLSLSFGEEEDFLELVKDYIQMRFKWEKWSAPAPLFVDWVKAMAKRPLFNKGALGIRYDHYF
jgi:hypothetical protein